ncbi:hypothetical protein ACP70R_039824 [Stipagrostis hirtigluma subsp. patula]
MGEAFLPILLPRSVCGGFGKFCTGAHTGLEKFIEMAYAQVAVYGFTERLGLCPRNDDSFEVVKHYSNQIACNTHQCANAVGSPNVATVMIKHKEIVEFQALSLSWYHQTF